MIDHADMERLRQAADWLRGTAHEGSVRLAITALESDMGAGQNQAEACFNLTGHAKGTEGARAFNAGARWARAATPDWKAIGLGREARAAGSDPLTDEQISALIEAHDPDGETAATYRFARAAFDAGWTRALAARPAAVAVEPQQFAASSGYSVARDGEVVVTRDPSGAIVAVTRQDDEGCILKVIARSEARAVDEGSGPLTDETLTRWADRFAKMQDFKHAAEVRAALAARSVPAADAQPVAAWKCQRCGNTSDCRGATPDDNWCNSCATCDTMQPLYAGPITAPAAAGAAPCPGCTNSQCRAAKQCMHPWAHDTPIEDAAPQAMPADCKHQRRCADPEHNWCPDCGTDLPHPMLAATQPTGETQGSDETAALARSYIAEDDATESNVGKLLKLGRRLADATQASPAAAPALTAERIRLIADACMMFDTAGYAGDPARYVSVFARAIERDCRALARPAAGAGEGLTLALLTEAQNVEPVEDAPGASGLRWALGRALSDALGSTSEDGFVQVDPHDSDNIDPLVDAVLAALAGRTAQGGQE